jgi:HlyD family secretion protein
VSAQVSEADIGKVTTGQKVTLTVSAFPNKTFTGRVARVEPIGVTTSNVVNYNVISTVDPTDVALLPNMTATVTIITDERDDVTLVPTAAITFASTQAAQLRQTQGGQTGAGAQGGQGGQGGGFRGQGGQGGAQGGQASPAAQGSPGAQSEQAGQGGQRGQGGQGGGFRGAGRAGAVPSPSPEAQSGQPTADQAQQPATADTSTAFVIVMRDGQPVPTRIQVGANDDRNTQVVSGLQPGEIVAISATGGQTSQRSTGAGGLFPGAGPRPGGFGGGNAAPKPGGTGGGGR